MKCTSVASMVLLVAALAGGIPLSAGTKRDTADFLCSPDDAGRSAAILQEASPLFGASEIYVSRSGKIVVVDVRRDPKESVLERRYELENAEVSQRLFELLCSADVLGAKIPRGIEPPTCISTPNLILRGVSGGAKQVPFTRDGPDGSGRFEEAWLALSDLKRRTVRETPVYEGPYDPGYVPEGFSWAREILAALKDVAFTPVADPEAMARAQAEFEERVELQLEAIERVRADQQGARP